MTAPDPKAVAAGLSEAEKRLLTGARQYPEGGLIHQYPLARSSLDSVLALWRRGLIETSDEFNGPDAWEEKHFGYATFTPLCLAVRAELEKQP